MELDKQLKTACVLTNAVEVASGILNRLDGNTISSTEDGPRDIDSDIAITLNRMLSDGLHGMKATAVGGNNAA